MSLTYEHSTRNVKLMNSTFRYLGSALFFLVACLAAHPNEVRAQYKYKWIDVGDFRDQYSDAGIRITRIGMIYPANERGAVHDSPEGPALWIAARTDENRFVDPSGNETPLRIAHGGPYAIGGDARTQFLPISGKMVRREEAPEVYVDGALSFRNFVEVDSIAPNLPSVASYVSRTNTTVGIQIRQTVHAFSQEYHDDYHVIEYEFANTGNLDQDPEIEMPGTTLQDVWFYFLRRPVPSELPAVRQSEAAGWGKYTLNDVVGDGMEAYDVDFRAQFSWLGHMPEGPEYNALGAPSIAFFEDAVEADTLGRLAGAQMHGQVIIHADEYAHAPSTTAPDDPTQPVTTGHIDNDLPVLSELSDLDPSGMLRQYDNLITSGHKYPHHADLVAGVDAATLDDLAETDGDPSMGTEGGWGYHMAFGPYTIEPGQVVRLVLATGVGSLSQEAKVEIGRTYAELEFDDEALIGWNPKTNSLCDPGPNCVEMTKNRWVMSTRDSLFQTFERAIANYNSGYAIPKAPLPPRRLDIIARAEEVVLEWETYAGANPESYEIWRAASYYDFPPAWEQIAEVDGSATTFQDTNAKTGLIPGREYYYAVVSVGPVNTDPTALTPTGVPLKSSIHQAMAFLPAVLKRAPPENPAEMARVVPNPFNLGASSELRFPGNDNRIAFLDIPGECTIRIYTQTGELVKVIEHTDGSGNEFWNLITDSRQLIASGLYVALILDENTGQKIVRKFIVIR